MQNIHNSRVRSLIYTSTLLKQKIYSTMFKHSKNETLVTEHSKQL